MAVAGGVGGHEDARSPHGPEEGKDLFGLDAGDGTCHLVWLPVMPGC